ncbi:MAG: polysaccharide biosynthesis/export family protein [Verrucomicrobiota bacterium]
MGNGASLTGTNVSNSIVLREGDVVKLTFPGAANLNTVQPIRRDGKITLQMGGEITAAGMTPTQLEAEVIRRYAPQLLTKEVTVSVESSSFPVFVMGAVLKPGKFLADRPLTALEAIMEAGGFDNSKANAKNVLVIRNDDGEVKNFRLNLKDALRGKTVEPFSIKPHDIIYVPEKFSWF